MKIMEKARRFLRFAIGLRAGTDIEGTISTISANVRLSGVNIWLLVCSAILASIGLDINSNAVIIGAMLISPLMSPILGVGLGIATFDRNLLRRGLGSLSLAMFVGLFTSTAYFFVTPFGELTTELSARTTPTVLDVGVAFFGGVAGIVAGSRIEKTNAIPGVAIATALMPPLCTSGFGLAKQDWVIFAGAIYLFFINAVFIAIATYTVSAYLRFPKRSDVDAETYVAVRRFVIGLAVVTIIPSGIILYDVLKRARLENSVKRFINSECRQAERWPLQWEILNDGERPVLRVYMAGKEIDPTEKERLQRQLDSYRLSDLKLEPVQLNVSIDRFNRVSTDLSTNLTENSKILRSLAEERGELIRELRSELEIARVNSEPRARFIADATQLFPEVANFVWQDETENGSPALGIAYRGDISAADRKRIASHLTERARILLAVDDLKIVEIPSAGSGM